MKWIIDIHSKKPYPANILSNYASNTFYIDGIEVASMEGFLQSLKEQDPVRQKEICLLDGPSAKKRGTDINWQESGLLYWQGMPIHRNSFAYRELISHAYDQLLTNSVFREALTSTGRCILFHSVGKVRKKDTCLTMQEFLYQMYRVRRKIRRT